MYARNPKLYGIGYVFNGNGIVGIDLDGVMEDGQLTEAAKAMLEELNTYTEVSPSGKGVHCLVYGQMPGGKGKKVDELEMYDRGRYFTVTGDILYSYSTEMQHRQEFISKKAKPQAQEVNPDVDVDFYIKARPEPPFLKIEALKDVYGKVFAETLNMKRVNLKDKSMSGYDFALANYAHQGEFTDQEIVDLLVWFRQKHGGKPKHVDYYRRTLLKLRGEAEGKSRFVAADPVEGKRLGSDQLGVQIERIVQVGDNRNARWYLEIKGRERPYEIGTTKEFLMPVVWQAIAVDLARKQLKIPKKQWGDFIQLLLDISVKEDVSEIDDLEEANEYIEEYIDSRQNAPCQEESEEEFKLAFLNRKPYIDKDGLLNFTTTGLHRWILTEHQYNYGQRVLAIRLKADGYKGRQVGRRIDGKMIKRRYWVKARGIEHEESDSV